MKVFYFGLIVFIGFGIYTILEKTSSDYLIQKYCGFKSQQESNLKYVSGFAFRDKDHEVLVYEKCLSDTKYATIGKVLVKYSKIDRTDCEFCF